eukprot:m.323056 g.323056  ORF g.323056 m.323056 type:complete len:271 (+) comp16455_c0_seq29:354-1166(+)
MALSTLSVLILVLICFVFVLMLIIYIVFRKISKNMRDIHTTDAVHAREEPVTKFGVVHSAESSPSTQSGGSINQSREGQARALKDLAPWVEEPVDRWSEQQQLASIVRMKVSAEKATDAPSRQYSRTTIDQQLLAMRDATDGEVALILSDKRVTPGTTLKIQADLTDLSVKQRTAIDEPATPPRQRREDDQFSDKGGSETPYGFGSVSPVRGVNTASANRDGALPTYATDTDDSNDESSPELQHYENGEQRAAEARPHAPVPTGGLDLDS